MGWQESVVLLGIAALLSAAVGGLGFWQLVEQNGNEEHNIAVMIVGIVLACILVGMGIYVIAYRS